MILMAYRHGLRASEVVDLRWDQIDFDTANLSVRRTKKGSPSTHPILGVELRALRRLNREQEPKSAFVFTSERGSPFTTAGLARLVERAGAAAELGSHPHMLRHACGFALANKGHDTRAPWGTRIFSIPFVIRSWHLIGSRTSGGEECSHTKPIQTPMPITIADMTI
jgi:integrase